MRIERLLIGTAIQIAMLPTLAQADLVFVGHQSEMSQGFDSVLNILTMQNTPAEFGAVEWDTQRNVIFGTGMSGCPGSTPCIGSGTGTSNNPGMTSTQMTSSQTIGFNAQNLAITLNLSQTGANPTITLESPEMDIWSTSGVLLSSDSPPAPHVFTAIVLTPEEVAKKVTDRDPSPPGRPAIVQLTVHFALPRAAVERFRAQAIREGRNLEEVVAELLARG